MTGLVASTLAKSLETPHAADMVAQLVEADNHKLSEIEAGAAEIGKPLSQVRSERQGLVLGLVHAGHFDLGLAADPVVQAGDQPAPRRAARLAEAGQAALMRSCPPGFAPMMMRTSPAAATLVT